MSSRVLYINWEKRWVTVNIMVTLFGWQTSCTRTLKTVSQLNWGMFLMLRHCDQCSLWTFIAVTQSPHVDKLWFHFITGVLMCFILGCLIFFQNYILSVCPVHQPTIFKTPKPTNNLFNSIKLLSYVCVIRIKVWREMHARLDHTAMNWTLSRRKPVKWTNWRDNSSHTKIKCMSWISTRLELT